MYTVLLSTQNLHHQHVSNQQLHSFQAKLGGAPSWPPIHNKAAQKWNSTYGLRGRHNTILQSGQLPERLSHVSIQREWKQCCISKQVSKQHIVGQVFFCFLFFVFFYEQERRQGGEV